MQYINPQTLVNTEWLASNLNNPNIRIVDASYFLPGVDRDPIQEFIDNHIPGAVFFDIEEIADQDSTQLHMLPDAIRFSEKVSKLGISNKEKVIVYDTNGGSMAAARCWWMFRVFEHKNVALLNGGFPKWISEKRPTENLITTSKNINPLFFCKKMISLVSDIILMLINF